MVAVVLVLSWSPRILIVENCGCCSYVFLLALVMVDEGDDNEGGFGDVYHSL